MDEDVQRVIFGENKNRNKNSGKIEKVVEKNLKTLYNNIQLHWRCGRDVV